MIVQHNILAMNANRNVKLNTLKVSDNTKKLASGYRINNAADDAAGLAISEKMRKLIHGLSQGSSNAQEGISMVQTAEGALNEVHDMIQRMNELAIQAANETYSDSDREALQLEFEHLQDEIDRISNTTTFNEKLLFSLGVDEAEFDDISDIRAGFNSEILNKINGINEDGTGIDNTQNLITTYNLRGVPQATTVAELPVGTGNIDLTSLTDDFVITDTGYILNGTEYSYKGAYKFTGSTTHKVSIKASDTASVLNLDKVTISLTDGASLNNIQIGKYTEVTLKTEGTSSISNVSVESNGNLNVYKNSTVTSEVNIDNINNSGNITLETDVKLSGVFNNNNNIYLRNGGKLNINYDITNKGYIGVNGGCELVVNGTFTNNGSISNSGTLEVKGDINHNNNSSYSFNSSGTMRVEGNLNNTGTAILGGTVEANIINIGTINVNGNCNVKGEMSNKSKLNVNYRGNFIVQNTLSNEGSILIDGGGTLRPVASLVNTNIGNIRINTFGTLDVTGVVMSDNGKIQVEDHYKIVGNQGVQTESLDTVTLNFNMLSDVSLNDKGFEVSGRVDSPYDNKADNRTYVIKGQTSHSSLDDLNITSGNVKLHVDESKIYVDKLNVLPDAKLEIVGTGYLIADNISGDAPIEDPKLFKYSNGTIDLGTINGTLKINNYGYKVEGNELKYYIETYTDIKFLGSSANQGDNSDTDVNIEINNNGRDIYIEDANDCIVNSVKLNTTGVDIKGSKLVATEIINDTYVTEAAQLYKMGNGNIDVSSINGTLVIGDNYYKYSDNKLKYYNAGEYNLKGTKYEANINIISPNVINVDEKCYVGTVRYDSSVGMIVNGTGKLICKKVFNANSNGIIDGEITATGQTEIKLSEVKDFLVITDNGYKLDNVNYAVEAGEGVRLVGSTDKDIYIDSERVVSLDGVDAIGKFVVLQPIEGTVQVVGDNTISNLSLERGSELKLYGDGPLHIIGESFNDGKIVSEEVEVYQEGIFSNVGEFVNQSNIVNEGIINNAEDGNFINKATIENEGIINNLAKFENNRDGIINNNKFLYNIGEFNNNPGAILDNNSIIENKYKLRNEGTLDNYEGGIDNYYSVSGTILGNQPIYIYDGSRTKNSLDIQAGAEKDDKIDIDILQMNARVLGLQKDRVNIRTSEDTINAITGITFALNRLSQQRSMLGSFQNRLEHTIRNLDNAVENTTSAESSIRDTDMAKEMVAYSNNNILSQSAQAMLAQANQINSGVLSLLS